MNEQFLNKRFGDRQEQIKKLIVYAELMGLTGSDLISIGSKMKRMAENSAKERNLDSIAHLEPLPIGKDPRGPWTQAGRFKLKTPSGNYNFFNNDYNHWKIQSCSTNNSIHYKASESEFPKSNWRVNQMRSCLLDYVEGRLLLNF